MNPKIVLGIFLVLLSLSAHAVTLESNGQVHTITQGNLVFETDGRGRVDVFRGNTHLGEFAFSLGGTIDGTPRFLNSWEADWTWQVLSNTDENVTVLGSASWQGLDWNQYWYFSDSEQKFAHFVENQTGFDSIDTKLYFVVNTDSQNVGCLDYIDDEELGRKYCFNQDLTVTQNLGQYLKRISFVDTLFDFQDLIDSGFEFDYLFAGNLNNAHADLPTTTGFIIGVTKNNGFFPNGSRVVLDPSIVDTSNKTVFNYDNVLARDSIGDLWFVYSESTETQIDVWVSKSTDQGVSWNTFNLTNSSDFNEVLPHIDINSTNGLTVAYDSYIAETGTTTGQVKIATCSSGGCDAAAEFLVDVNVSQCSATGDCGNNNFLIDQNNTSHLTYVIARGGTSFTAYRSNTGYSGLAANWSADTNVISGLGTIVYSSTGGFPDSTGVLVSKNGSGKKLAFTTTNGSQLYASYYDGTNWQRSLFLAAPGQSAPIGAYAGYDGNFYLAYGRFDGGTYTSLNFLQCDIDTNCSNVPNWNVDVNFANGLESSNLSMIQAADLNVYIFAGSRPASVDSNIHIFTRLPDGVWTTSTIGDGNLLQNDANRTFNALVRNKDYLGSTVAAPSPLSRQTNIFDYIYLTSNVSGGDPSTFVFDSNGEVNTINASFTTTPSSPYVLTTDLTNIAVDLNSTTDFFGVVNDINYLWQIDSEEISTDQNTVWDFNGLDEDYNISLIVMGNDGLSTLVSQSDLNVVVINVVETFDINFSLNQFSNNADVNIGGLFAGGTSAINYIVWSGTNLDINRLGLQVRVDYNAGGIKQVCGIFNTSSDLNSLYCESFNITEVLVKIPLDEETPANTLSPFEVTVNGTAPQNYVNQSADLNVFAFDQNVNQFINIGVDFNTSYFPRNYGIFSGQTGNLFFTIQPYLALVANSIQVVWITQNVFGDDTLPNIEIVSKRSISSILTEVESPITDATGSATMTFIPQIPYELTFDLNGITIFTGTYIPNSTDTTKNAFLSITAISSTRTIQDALDVNFTPPGGVIIVDSQHNATLTQNISVLGDGNLSSLRIRITHGSGVLSDTNHSTVGTFNQTLDFSGRDFNTQVIVTITGVISGNPVLVQKTYSIGISSLIEIFRVAKEKDFGHTGSTLLAVLITVIGIGGLINFTQTERGNESLSFLVIPIMMFFALLGWVSWIPVIFGSAGAIVLYFAGASSRGGF